MATQRGSPTAEKLLEPEDSQLPEHEGETFQAAFSIKGPSQSQNPHRGCSSEGKGKGGGDRERSPRRSKDTASSQKAPPKRAGVPAHEVALPTGIPPNAILPGSKLSLQSQEERVNLQSVTLATQPTDIMAAVNASTAAAQAVQQAVTSMQVMMTACLQSGAGAAQTPAVGPAQAPPGFGPAPGTAGSSPAAPAGAATGAQEAPTAARVASPATPPASLSVLESQVPKHVARGIKKAKQKCEKEVAKRIRAVERVEKEAQACSEMVNPDRPLHYPGVNNSPLSHACMRTGIHIVTRT